MRVGPTFASRLAPPADPYEVGREAVRSFALAVGDDDPVYRDQGAARAAGHPDVIAPPTYVVSLTMRSEAQAAADAFGDIDLADMLHREQAFEYARPVRVGDRLVVTSKSEISSREIEGRKILTLETDVSTAEGEHVCTAYSVMVYSGQVTR
jgi:acyl dehydratase